MQTPVYEVAVVTVAEEKVSEFLKQQKMAHDIIQKFKGFKSIRSMRSMESPNTFADYCEWESYEDAVKANEQAMKMPELQMFFELGDGMITFGRYNSLLTTEVK